MTVEELVLRLLECSAKAEVNIVHSADAGPREVGEIEEDDGKVYLLLGAEAYA